MVLLLLVLCFCLFMLQKVLVVITGTLFLFVYVELQQAPELRIERLVKKALILLGSLQGLYGLYGFDAEVSPFLQWSRVIASVSHRHYQLPSFGSRELQR
ncbi:unnamed protein product [Prunus brigantina]